jgi:HJR/Mrr/RecB family endonuclease
VSKRWKDNARVSSLLDLSLSTESEKALQGCVSAIMGVVAYLIFPLALPLALVFTPLLGASRAAKLAVKLAHIPFIIPIYIVLWPFAKIFNFSITVTLEPEWQPHTEALRESAQSVTHQMGVRSVSDNTYRFRRIIAQMSGAEFEQFTADLLRAMGFERVSLTPATGDEGKDVIAYLRDPLGNLIKYYVECKRWEEGKPVGRPVVQRLHSAIIEDRSASKGMIVTSSRFTEQAAEWASRVGNIDLIDGQRLIELATRHGILDKYLPKERVSAPVSEPPTAVLERPGAATRQKVSLWPLVVVAMILCAVCGGTWFAFSSETGERASPTHAVPSLAETHTPTRPPTRTPTRIPTLRPSHTPTPAPVGSATVTVETANLRAGPGTIYDVAGSVTTGETLLVYAAADTEEGQWLQVDGNGMLWIWANLTELDLPADEIPLAARVPPTPTLTPTPDLTATARAAEHAATATARAQERARVTATIEAYRTLPPVGWWEAEVEGLVVTVGHFRYTKQYGSFRAAEGRRFVVFDIIFENQGPKSFHIVYALDIEVVDLENFHCLSDLESGLPWSDILHPGDREEGEVAVLIQEDTGPMAVVIEYDFAPWTAETHELVIDLTKPPTY